MDQEKMMAEAVFPTGFPTIDNRTLDTAGILDLGHYRWELQQRSSPEHAAP
ncbi:MAG TPA: hypothetical protein VGV37_06075 [Aliidongia sp.]|uniref:hypothetical protein n=1 Tax=Aliidongia sp. TaxID=1914230 RepID=UPI002DDD0A20|nr:hypothetical protein [Aliidongia sp.]HEV2674091.1 hypothetical protein [Aliidongia sp.]